MSYSKIDGNCKECDNYHDLRIPVKVDVNNYIHGYCFKDLLNVVSIVKGYPVYIPESNCKDFKQSNRSNEYNYSVPQEFKCECCKKQLLSKIAKQLN